MKNALRNAILLSTCALTFYATAAHALPPTPTPADIPPASSAGQVQKNFQDLPTLLNSPDLHLPVPGEPGVSKDAQAKLEKVKFTLNSADIEGATIYTADQLKFAYADMIGKKISLLDAQDIAQKITALYHKDGYILSQAVVPAQDVSGGVLKIRVVEGYVGGVIIPDGVATDSERKILESYLKHVQDERPVRTQTLEHYLLLIDDLPGVNVTGLLRPSATEVGSADLVINLTQKEFEGSYTFDNRGSKFIGPWQHTAAFAANDMLGLYDRTRVRLFTTSTDPNQLFGAELTHEEVVGSEGGKVSFLASHTHTQPGDYLEPLDLVGNSNLYEARFTQPFIRSRGQNLVARALFDYHDTTTDIFKHDEFTTDRLRVLRLGGTYTVADNLKGNNVVDMQVSQGLNIFGASESGADRSNAVGDSDFTKINLDLSRLQNLPDQFSFLAAASMQHSFNPLLSDEQFTLGGTEYARAFDPAELLGDQGLAGKGELRYTDSVGKSYFDSYQLYTYYDIGRVWLVKGAAGSSDTAVLSSTGVGTRLTFTENFSANFEADFPLVAPGADQTSYRHEPRLFMSLTARF